MAFEHYKQVAGKRLRCGYTTGTCAALAAAGAVRLLLTGRAPETVSLCTPGGLTVEAALLVQGQGPDWAACGVVKDGGDDVDATDGALICARVRRMGRPGVQILGGPGVGRVTRPGLDQPVGQAAINRVPRQMLEQQVLSVCDQMGCEEGMEVTVYVPQGEALAEKTFNPRLGIEGGISILGTSGIVEPMSIQAIVETTALELRQAAAAGARQVVLTPGNYGLDFWEEHGINDMAPIVKCSNFIGEALDEAAALGFSEVLLVGHVGKLVKLAGGVMNTHSRWADCRMELFCAHAAVCGGDSGVCRALMDAATTDGCIAILDQAGLRQKVLASLLEAVQRHLTCRVAGACRVGALLFSNEYGLLGMTSGAEEMMRRWKE